MHYMETDLQQRTGKSQNNHCITNSVHKIQNFYDVTPRDLVPSTFLQVSLQSLDLCFGCSNTELFEVFCVNFLECQVFILVVSIRKILNAKYAYHTNHINKTFATISYILNIKTIEKNLGDVLNDTSYHTVILSQIN